MVKMVLLRAPVTEISNYAVSVCVGKTLHQLRCYHRRLRKGARVATRVAPCVKSRSPPDVTDVNGAVSIATPDLQVAQLARSRSPHTDADMQLLYK